MTFFYAKNDEKFGPVSIAELKEAGINKDTLIWYEGLDTWQKAGNVLELADLFKSVPPPLPNMKTAPPPIPKIEKKKESNTSVPDTKRYNTKILGVALIAVACIIVLFIVFKVFNNSNNPLANTTKSDSHSEQTTQQNNNQQQDNERLAEQQRQERLRQQEEQRMIAIRNAFPENVKVEANYDYSDLGGIDNAFVIIYNNNDYAIDEVSISAFYIKRNGETYKTEYLTANNIPAKGKIIVMAPPSDRGIKLDVDISEIYVRDINLCFTFIWNPLSQEIEQEDPYKCQ